MSRRPRWWRDAVFYQVYPRSFADSDGDGVGDLRGITDRLDHLAGAPDSLGVDAIWLSPFYRSPMADFGYDIVDHTDVDPLFGTLRDADDLIREAHARQLRVIVDLVPNHTSDRHPWFRASRSSRSSPFRDWYVWRPGVDGRPPNNWMSEFAAVGPAWTFDDATGEWYLHSFLREQPDLHWDNPKVERAIHEVMRFWLGRGVDGFRMDAVYKIAKDPRLRDNPRPIVGPGVVPDGRFDEDWPTMRGRLTRLRTVLREFGDRMMVGEVYLLDRARLAAYINTGRRLDLAHDFTFLNNPWSARAFRTSVMELERLAGARGWPTWCLNNHDHPRVASRYPGEAAARVAALMLLTLRGTPFLYQGEELGLEDGIVPPDATVDIDGRDPERCPIPWGPPSRAGPGAGFTSGAPWLPLPPDAEHRNVETQRRSADSILALYRRLLRLRRATPALRRGTLHIVATAAEDAFAYVRSIDDRALAIVLNFGVEAIRVDVPLDGRVIEATDQSLHDIRTHGGRLELPPCSGAIIG